MVLIHLTAAHKDLRKILVSHIKIRKRVIFLWDFIVKFIMIILIHSAVFNKFAFIYGIKNIKLRL